MFADRESVRAPTGDHPPLSAGCRALRASPARPGTRGRCWRERPVCRWGPIHALLICSHHGSFRLALCVGANSCTAPRRPLPSALATRLLLGRGPHRDSSVFPRIILMRLGRCCSQLPEPNCPSCCPCSAFTRTLQEPGRAS